MTTKRRTRRALLNSIISLMLCFVMLLGTTFAWFTDSVTSSNNIIKSGTLDVELNYSTDGTNWKDASTGAIFDYEYWEPGYVDSKHVQIVNNGNLALKYRLDVIPAMQVAAGEKNLADVIDVYMFPAGTTVDRATIAAATPVGTLSTLMADADGAAYGVLLPEDGSSNVKLNAADAAIAKTGSESVIIALKMQESAGNEYQNLAVGGGSFKVQLLATQYTYENDSFDNMYDDDAEYTEIPNADVTFRDDLLGAAAASLDWNDSYSMVRDGDPVEFDAAYTFTAPVDGDTAAKSPYAKYLADFAVSFSDDITPDMGVGIAGEYGSWQWIGFLANDALFNELGITKLDKDVKYDLLGSFGININFEELCDLVKVFTCSTWADNAEGTTITVELRLYETYPIEESAEHNGGVASANVKTGEYITIGTYSHTF